MPSQEVCDPVNVNVHANSMIPYVREIMSYFFHVGPKSIWYLITHKFHAICSVRNAILGPTPGREQSSSTVFGRSESKSSRSLRAAFFRYLLKRCVSAFQKRVRKRKSRKREQVVKKCNEPSFASPKADFRNGFCYCLFFRIDHTLN